MKISKRTREQAALICAIAASNPGMLTVQASDGLGLRWGSDAGWLVRRCRASVEYATNARGTRGYQEACAEAALLIEEGWSP